MESLEKNFAREGISVVIPVYRSEKVLPILIGRLESVLREVTSNFELVLVNDCSPDRSWEVISNLIDEHSWIRAIDLMRNFGQHNALLCGIRAAQFDTIVTMDDDLQHPPEEIPKLLTVFAQSGCDVLYGTPTHDQYGLMRKIATFVTKLALRTVMDAKVVQDVSAFRVIRSQVATAFRNYEAPFVSIDVLLTWGTSRFGSIRIRHEPRHEGTSGYTLRKLASHTMNLVTGFTALPLRIASIVGFLLSWIGFGVLCYVLVRYLFLGDTVPGFPFLASIVAIFSGAQLFSIGIIGEYLARMHFRSMQMPTYVIRTSAGKYETAVKGSTK
jgi:undecaprenyl-phosphate 4-deoxy-4-formamido-L-arabinose transferase